MAYLGTSPVADHGTVRLVAAGPHECVPHAVPLQDLHLPSLRTAQIQQWLAEHADRRILVIPDDGSVHLATADGPHHRCPARTLTVSEAEYREVLAMQPYSP